MHRRRRGFSLAEIGLTLVLLAVVLALTAPRIITANQAAGARTAQASLELVASAAVDHYLLAGTPPDEPADVAAMVPQVSLLATATASTTPKQVSITAADGAVVLAASDGEGFCWVLVRHLIPSGPNEEVKVAVPDDGCSAFAATGYASSSPPPGVGTSWSAPWTP